MMCRRRIVVHRCLPRVSIWGLAVCVWGLLGAREYGGVRNEISLPATEARMALHTVYGCREREYVPQGSRRFGGPDLEMSENGLTARFSITSQRKSVA